MLAPTINLSEGGYKHAHVFRVFQNQHTLYKPSTMHC